MPDKRDLTPEQEARVARLLAEARVEEPVPPDVAARLDEVLAGLAGEPVAGPEPSPAPVDLATRRRRRVRVLLVAAAAVVVAGVGVGQLVEPRDSDSGDAGVASVEASDEAGGMADDEGERESPLEDGESLLTADQLESLGEPARIRARSFAASVRRLQDRPGVRSDAGTGLMDDSDLAAPKMDFSCGAADYGSGKLIAVRYQGSPAVLAYRPAAGDTQVVELLQCGSGEVIRSTTVPLP